jgi:uncharacterized protein
VSGTVSIPGARVLVTGATGGLGQAIARDLAARGAKLVLTGRRSSILEPLAAEFGARGLVVDLADRTAVERLAEDAADCDVLVMNAALPGSGRIESYSPDQLDRTLDVNLRAPIVLAQRLVPGLVERRRGHLVFISSLAGKTANAGGALYSATKFGIRGFALALRADLAGSGVGVTIISPGFIRDAGMFAESGVKLPPGVGTRSPGDVCRAVVRAIERDPAEIDVAPVTLRAGAAAAGLAPGLAEKVTRRLGAHAVADGLSAGQTSKR